MRVQHGLNTKSSLSSESPVKNFIPVKAGIFLGRRNLFKEIPAFTWMLIAFLMFF